MKKQLRNSIRKAYNKLTDDEKETLSLISILCVDIDGAAVDRECLVDGISQIVPFRRGGVGLVDGQVHTHNRDVVS